MKVGLIALGILILLLAWVALDLTLGRKQRIVKTKISLYPIRTGAIRIFTRGDVLFEDYFRELKNAKHYIHVLFYIVKEDALSKEFLTILREKARAGVEVRLMADWLGSLVIKKSTIASLKKDGIKFTFCHKPRLPFLFYTVQARNHRKITVIDGRLGYLGGFNIGNEYVGLDPKLSPWRDYHLKMTGEAVGDLQEVILSDWKEATGEDLLQNKIYFSEGKLGPATHQVIPTSGSILEDLYLDIFKKAKHRIIIGSPYFVPSKKLFNELVASLQRGIELTIIIPANADHPLVHEASYRYLRKLIGNGARVYQYRTGFYHAKTLLIDDTVCDIGTANFDKRSLFLNSEINCYIYDQALIQETAAILEKDIEDSKPLEISTLNKPNLVRSFKEIIARAVTIFL